ncbi:GNAT family N-acetyltransferase [Pseudoclavibacter sp. AY1H1]|uniref:GNAT family N-acetyltransferase n=1 Tax=Pseudoclavibacter sp. AY1H1 TaxID=2080584 RepID=UPI000CE8E095|nr:GNAT family N-acetyltransferase [Pseudoclavibacter sp. AY1H1]PPF33359.1 hypothetical protein C5E05_17570 [Pseudoclavibacter sp. AY1H1]
MQFETSFLIDTNVLIAAEPFAGQLEELSSDVSSFLQLARRYKHRVLLHPATLEDLGETRDAAHRAQNEAAFRKYDHVADTGMSPEVLDVFPDSPSRNDLRDARILSALHVDTVDFLVTNDEKLRKRAIRLGHDPRVLRPYEAARQLETWHPQAPAPPPAVEYLPAEALDGSQAIFEGLRHDYPDFDTWLAKLRKDAPNRHCWVVRGAGGRYDGIALVKARDEHPSQRGRYAVKLSTFKVSDQANGRRLGELLLKTVLTWAHGEPGCPPEMFVEVKTDKERLLTFLEDFGFAPHTNKGPAEAVYVKSLRPEAGVDLSGLEFNRRYGPPALRAGQPIFVVPIVPHWFRSLFPDAPDPNLHGLQALEGMVIQTPPHGNAIRKAYLCGSKTSEVPEGSTLLFYRSQGQHEVGGGAVVAIGVAERSFRTTDPRATMRVAFKRTVFTDDDVARMHRATPAVLTILFRHDRFPDQVWPVRELNENQVLKSWPQSITRVRNKEGIAWVEQRLNVWP